MGHLKDESLKKCVSLLREFIHESPTGKKGTAMLALEHLQKITAGTGGSIRTCATRPRA
ncbi:MAG: hypothetical protein GTO45_38690 [Candidatus Aminicenantes bacterium]|nr:hypothetical protein [Candidatus Aminicenantes bacterium]NIM84553.1 hypothetical protein [Candidatus Aminicenantes bacterium]NIN24073.1 hypothetical protein [Candidatus Aminicenantes bacterium]NIN47779.1 hypothetical protein [Candidatus Aminicenantes bacterium]NIN90717.1 hypothetical protein [Candidatus Aminicenantes bacterium]